MRNGRMLGLAVVALLMVGCAPRVSARATARPTQHVVAASPRSDPHAWAEDAPSVHDTVKVDRRRCDAYGPGECFAAARTSTLSTAEARARCEALSMRCSDFMCTGSYEYEGRSVDVACLLDPSGEPVFEARSLRAIGENRPTYAASLVGAYRRFLADLGYPPTSLIERSRPPSFDDSYVSPGGGGGVVHVRSYMRKDGTRVRAHTRSAPRRR